MTEFYLNLGLKITRIYEFIEFVLKIALKTSQRDRQLPKRR